MSDPSKKETLKKLTQDELNAKIAEYEQWHKKTHPEGEMFPLNKLDLSELNFPRLNLIYLDLSDSDLSKSKFPNANFNQSNLTNANFASADISSAKFSFTECTNVNFSGANLLGADFSKIKLVGSTFIGGNLSGVKFMGADLARANLTDANLTDAKFCYTGSQSCEKGANLISTKFLNATMHGADLRDTKTAGMQLGGADVTNAKLPDEIKSFEGLKIVEEASKITKRLFTVLLSGLGFSILTILSTKDVALLTNSTTSPLPIIQTPIPLASFYWVAPILLSTFFAYFLLNLLHLYQIISRLPAVFPDGTTLDEKIYPWLLNTLVREFFPKLNEKKITLFWLRKVLIVFLALWSTPIVLVSFWLRYLPRHDFGWSYFYVFLIASIIFLTIWVYDKTIQTLKNDPNYIWPLKRSFQFGWALCLILSIGITAFTQFGNLNFNYQGGNLNNWLVADISEQDVSHKPENWNKEKPTEGVKGATLEVANLDYANAKGAFLVKAKLSRSSLIGAHLEGAYLSGAHLNEANLNGAYLVEANLKGADLEGASLHRADLKGADLKGAYLVEADFRDTRSMTSRSNIKNAKYWQLAFYDNDFKKSELQLSDDEIKLILCAFWHERSTLLPEKDFSIAYEKRLNIYQQVYGRGFVTQEDKLCGKAGNPDPSPEDQE